MKVYSILAFTVLFPSVVFGQGLFESASSITNDGESKNFNYKLSGYVRGTSYFGKVYNADNYEVKSAYGEAALIIEAAKSSLDSFNAEVRFRSGFEYGKSINEFELREAFITRSLGKLDLKFGKQIVVWGKADGFNPSNNITPNNGVVRSPNPDDLNIGNILLRANYQINKTLELEGIYVPVYRSSIMSYDLLPWPEGSYLGSPVLPEPTIENGSFALKFKYNGAKADFSLSALEGYDILPGMYLTDFVLNPDYSTETTIASRSYRDRIIGFDFSTSMYSFGIRGEAAYKYILGEDRNQYYSPFSEFYYVLGIDKSFGDFSCIVQYIGKYIQDYMELSPPVETGQPQEYVEYELAKVNRLYFQQSREVLHSVSVRPALNLFYDNLTIDCFGLYNISTEEFMIRPQLSYKIADAMKLSVGGEYFNGNPETLYKLISPIFNSVFVELKMSF